MPVRNPSLIEVFDEGVSQGFVSSVDFTGTGVTATASGFQATVNVTGGGGSISATTIEVDLGPAHWQGEFTVVDAAIGPTSKVLAWQAPGPYTGKGTLADEGVLQPVKVTIVEALAGSARFYWETPPIVTYNKNPLAEPLTLSTPISPKDPFNRVYGMAMRIGKVEGNVKFSYLVLN